ncbi:uncharacterized protein LOC132642536 [Lycium barbarum]|uniref:uncharacterized protein LOC132642536 n=1 Tax=Lycium barbarum TaxID=112863 RepID=UPI00293F2365|nr:uncharacterized protein LOC132642536 [Lycium barbarum]XP_060215661.1 uncharacterized protein LOC132642536 [Lycium barbarum]
MVFPLNSSLAIYTKVVFVTHSVLRGVTTDGHTKYFDIIPIILSDIYRALRKCLNRYYYFHRCNLLVQSWILKHLDKNGSTSRRDPAWREDDRSVATVPCGVQDKVGWAHIFSRIREEHIKWRVPDFYSKSIFVNSCRRPYLPLMGIRGIRPYTPLRVLRQFDMRQVIPNVGDMGEFVRDYEEGHIEGIQDARKDWKNVTKEDKLDEDPNNPGHDENYYEWLGAELEGTATPGPYLYKFLVDSEATKAI